MVAPDHSVSKMVNGRIQEKIVQSHAGGKMAITFINLYHFLVIRRPATDLTAIFKYRADEEVAAY